MSANEEADVLVEAKDGYGEHNEEAVQSITKRAIHWIAEGRTLWQVNMVKLYKLFKNLSLMLK